jgi:hypothetical protein
MKVFKLSVLFLSAALLITGCTKSDVADQVYNQQNQPYEIGRVEEGFLEDDELIGRENLDLQALGTLLEKANNAEDFEYLLNSDDGINNLDLNDDGYADYIGVREFGDNYDDERGFSLYSMFGDNLIQEIAQVIFDRDGYDDGSYYPGSRVLIRGNDYLYGDDYYYETNWSDRQVPIVDWVFNDRDNYYQSPYYYQNYPSYYEPYRVVETPVYLTRIEQYYYSPVFVQTTQPSVTEIKIVSPYRDVSLSQAYMKVPKPEREQRRQQILLERNNQSAQYEREKPGKTKDFSVREDKQFNDKQFNDKQSNDKQFNDKQFNDSPNRAGKQDKVINERQQQVRDQIRETRETREKPNKPERVDRQQQNQQKFERPQPQQKVERQQQQQQQRVERQQQVRPQQQMRVERQQQQRVERQPQQRVERQQQMNQPRPQQQQRQEVRVQPNGGGGGKQNGGGGNKGGGNNPGGGGGKGKGKP